MNHSTLGPTLVGIAALMTGLSANATDIARNGELACSVASETSHTTWQVELDESVPLAFVDDSDRPADYSPSHVRIRLTAEGPILTIGRVTGRVLATDNEGKAIGSGRCEPPSVARSHSTRPHAPPV